MSLLARNLLTVSFLTAVGLVLFIPTFKFALAGDDWVTLYRFITTYNNFSAYILIDNYRTNYDIANIIMGIIYSFAGFNPEPYYQTSLVLRIIAASSIFIALNTFTNYKVALATVTIFITSYVGIETTNWVFNMNTYLSIIVFSLFLLIFYKYKVFFGFNSLSILTAFILFIAFIIAPTRMHGTVFIIPLLLITTIKKITLQNILSKIYIAFMFIFPIFIYRIYISTNQDIRYFDLMLNIKSQNPLFLFNIFSSIGSSIIPNPITHLILNQIPSDYLGYIFMIPTILAFSTVVITSKLSKNPILFIITCTIFNLIFLCLFYLLLTNNPLGNFNNPMVIASSIIGAFFTIQIIISTIFTKATIGYIPIITLISGLSFLIIPWLISPESSFPSDHRYLMIPGIFFTISWVTIAMKISKKSLIYQIIVYSSIGFYILANAYSLSTYFTHLNNKGRNSALVNTIFKQIQSETNPYYDNGNKVYLITSKDPELLYNSINFGFSPHIMLISNPQILSVAKSPFIVDNFDSLVSIVNHSNREELTRYGYPNANIKPNNIYAFELENNNLTNITPFIRQQLSNNP